MSDNKTFLLELREAARECPSVTLAKQLKDVADELSLAIRKFNLEITEERLRVVNGLWVRGRRLLTGMPIKSGGPGGGRARKAA